MVAEGFSESGLRKTMSAANMVAYETVTIKMSPLKKRFMVYGLIVSWRRFVTSLVLKVLRLKCPD